MLPTITWFISSTSMPDREMTSLATVVPRSTAGTSLRAPPKVPMAVLKGVEITISVPLPLAKLMLLLYFVATYNILPKGRTVQTLRFTSSALLPSAALAPGPFVAGSIKLERGVEEPHVGVHPLLGEVLEDLLLLGGRLQEQRPAALELSTQRLDDVLKEVLGELHVPFLRLPRTLDDIPVGV